MMNTVSPVKQRHADREVGVRPERLERLLGTVGRRRQPVGSQAHPGEERNQRDGVKKPGVVKIARLAEQRPAELAGQRARASIGRSASALVRWTGGGSPSRFACFVAGVGMCVRQCLRRNMFRA